VTTILDTGPLVALLNRNDRYHKWALAAWEPLSLPLSTCEPVLTEAAHLTGAADRLMQMISDGILEIGFEMEHQADSLSALLRRYAPRMDLADACVVRMSELHRDSRVFTLDRRDFRIYRRNSRGIIPLLVPPD
jgi:uncharacterized protein